mgnify:CR=1 FL=1
MNSNIQGHTIMGPDGQQYFQIGKNCIKITEHFALNGKQINQLFEEFILSKPEPFPTKIL